MNYIYTLQDKFFSQPDVIQSIVNYDLKSLLQQMQMFDEVHPGLEEQFSFISQVRQSLVSSNLVTNEELCEQSIILPPGFFYKDRTLKDFVIPDNVGIIGDSAFEECAYLTQITLPKSVKRICISAFANCFSLETLIFEGSENDWMDIDFEDLWDYKAGLNTSKNHFKIKYLK